MSEICILPLIEPDGEQTDRVAALLRALGIEEVRYSLNGEGDSGESSLDTVRYRDGRDEAALPRLAIGFLSDGRPTLLDDYLGDLAENLPEGDWVNNEGGYGTVSILPFEIDPSDRFSCDMTYRDEYEGDDDEEEDDFAEAAPFGAIMLNTLGGSADAAIARVRS